MGTSDLRLEGVDLCEAVAFGRTGVAEAVVLDPCGVVAAVEDADDEVLGEAFGRVVVARSRLDACLSVCLSYLRDSQDTLLSYTPR